MPPSSKGKTRLYHRTPGWVPTGAVFHLRIRADPTQRPPLTHPSLAPALLESIEFYHDRERWYCHLCLLMPDHLHGLFVFPPDEPMSQVIKDWKSYHARRSAVRWQEGYFDHRIRDRANLDEKAAYIRQNPVVKGLCAAANEWPWKIEPSLRTKT